MQSFDFEIGDCRLVFDIFIRFLVLIVFNSVHSGWLFHRARKTNSKRRAITFSFVPRNTKRRVKDKTIKRENPSEVWNISYFFCEFYIFF